VVERVHPRLTGDASAAEFDLDGIRMQLDLRDYIQRRIYYRCHEAQEAAFVRAFSRPGDTVLDVGAHVGMFTLLAAAGVGPAGVVHAFEPVPSNFEALTKNVALNPSRHVVLNHLAVGAEPGAMTLGLPPSSVDSGGTSAMYTRGGTRAAITVPVTTLDEYVRERARDCPIRLLKLDVEGVEPLVLKGFRRGLAESPPDAILTEVNALRLTQQGYTTADLLDPLLQAGYGLYRFGAFGGRRRLDVQEVREADLEAHLKIQGGDPISLIRRAFSEGRIFFNLLALQDDESAADPISVDEDGLPEAD
jgi:FkbM family methyltransferase